jgi:hypothetical protein
MSVASVITGSKPGRLRAVLAAAAVLLLAGCASARHVDRSSAGPAAPGSPTASSGSTVGSSPTGPGATASADPSQPPCQQWSCQPGATAQLSDGYAVRLWTSAQPTAVVAPDRSTPVLELLHNGAHAQWWVGRVGFGWAAKLDCLVPRPGQTAADPNCAVLAQVGSHAGSAELVLLRNGALVSRPEASVVFDSGPPVAADLDHDGGLDVVGTENDYQPSYATGHNFWASYRLIGDVLHQTGCAPVRSSTEAPPAKLLTGDCPQVPQG